MLGSINCHVCAYCMFPVTCMCKLDHEVECLASHIVGEGSCHEWSTYVRGYQVYQAAWISAMGETLGLAVEATNSHDVYAVAIMQNGRDRTVCVVGHVPRNASGVISFFLKKSRSIGYCEVTGERTNHGVDSA